MTNSKNKVRHMLTKERMWQLLSTWYKTCNMVKCPFRGECLGFVDCKMRETASMLRTGEREIEFLKSEQEALKKAFALVVEYASDLQKMNNSLRETIEDFQMGELYVIKKEKKNRDRQEMLRRMTPEEIQAMNGKEEDDDDERCNDEKYWTYGKEFVL